MLRHGASTLNARTLREKTQTLPDHTSMLTGRTATGNQGHGVIVNHDPGGTVHQAAGHHISSMFTVVHDRGGSTALYASKSKFALFDRSWNARSGGRDRVGTNNGRDKIDRYHHASEEQLVDRLVHRLRQRPDSLSFLHLALPDEVGHHDGFGSRQYLRAVQRVDALLGRILRTIAHRPALRRHATVILTADHGGSGTGHRDPTRRAHFTIPFLVWGAGVADGADLYSAQPRPAVSRSFAHRLPGSAADPQRRPGQPRHLTSRPARRPGQHLQPQPRTAGTALTSGIQRAFRVGAREWRSPTVRRH